MWYLKFFILFTSTVDEIVNFRTGPVFENEHVAIDLLNSRSLLDYVRHPGVDGFWQVVTEVNLIKQSKSIFALINWILKIFFFNNIVSWNQKKC